ncbi:hypothetical protein [Microbulbifer taiwanensis]|uniref:Uncharacterized protein n=1 Tax=Microbulbifer taiwanensis TaxID=986746 RepID=A0ABW1YNI4_9GAMM|nr:hypothetical protein [Microbulbifer taiwanensis]
MRTLALSIIFVVLPLLAHAHQDRIIRLSEGKLVGLPEKYQPAILDLENRVFSIAGQKLILPDCYGKFFPETDEAEVFITASWYHINSDLPPYLSIRITEQGESIGHFFQLEPFGIYCKIEQEMFCEAINSKVVDSACAEKVQLVPAG